MFKELSLIVATVLCLGLGIISTVVNILGS